MPTVIILNLKQKKKKEKKIIDTKKTRCWYRCMFVEIKSKKLQKKVEDFF